MLFRSYLFSIALEKKLFVKEGGRYRPTFYGVSHEAFVTLNEIAVEFGRQAEDIFLRVKEIVWEHYAISVPRELAWQMGNLLSNHFYSLITCTYYEAVAGGKLSLPKEESKLWISLLVSENG